MKSYVEYKNLKRASREFAKSVRDLEQLKLLKKRFKLTHNQLITYGEAYNTLNTKIQVLNYVVSTKNQLYAAVSAIDYMEKPVITHWFKKDELGKSRYELDKEVIKRHEEIQQLKADLKLERDELQQERIMAAGSKYEVKFAKKVWAIDAKLYELKYYDENENKTNFNYGNYIKATRERINNLETYIKSNNIDKVLDANDPVEGRMNPLRPEVEIKDLTYIQRDLKEHVRIMNENLKMVDDACKPGKERNKEIIEEKKAELQRLIKENEERLDNNELEDIVEPIDWDNIDLRHITPEQLEAIEYASKHKNIEDVEANIERLENEGPVYNLKTLDINEVFNDILHLRPFNIEDGPVIDENNDHGNDNDNDHGSAPSSGGSSHHSPRQPISHSSSASDYTSSPTYQPAMHQLTEEEIRNPGRGQVLQDNLTSYFDENDQEQQGLVTQDGLTHYFDNSFNSDDIPNKGFVESDDNSEGSSFDI